MKNINETDINWQDMEQRLQKIEDTLFSMQTVLNLMIDLLSQAISSAEKDSDTDISEGSA